MKSLTRFLPDRFVQLLLATVVLASLLPVRGQAAEIASGIASAAIFLLFLLHGIRLPRAEVTAGFRNWRLQGGIFAFVFGGMALAGLALSSLFGPVIEPGLAVGLLFLGVLPSTVQSATVYCSIAKGNVAGSVVASALLNLASVVLTPLLFALLARASGVHITTDAALKIVGILLVPFALGQLLQNRVRPWLMARRDLANFFDRGSIAIAVYVAFSQAVVAGIWTRLDATQLAWLTLAVSVFLIIGFGGAWMLGGALGLSRPDRRTMLFSGAQKSIAVGAPLAAILFDAQMGGLVLLPVLFYHLAQLIVSAPLAGKLAEGMPEPA